MRDDVGFYKSINGKEYAKEFLDEIFSSQKSLWIQIKACIEHIRFRQNRRSPFSVALGNGLFEVRAKSNTLQGRINYCYDKSGIKLLNGYIKQDKGSMERGISLGRKLLKEKDERKKNEK